MAKQYPIEVPHIVQLAKAAATDLGFDLRPQGNPASGSTAGPSASLDEVGRLLQTLTATKPHGRIGEVGTGAGVGTAWMASALAGTASLISVELDSRLAHAASNLFASQANVEVITGDWQDVMPRRAPFDLLFFDGGSTEAVQPENWSVIAGLLAPAGIMVLDDLTPEERWPASWRGRPDAKRELAFRSGLFTATEVRVRTDSAVLLVAKVRN